MKIRRDAAGVKALLDAPMQEDPDLFSLTPAGLGFHAKSRRRSSVYPQPAVTAPRLAQMLQQWLQDEVLAAADTVKTARSVELKLVDPVPVIQITAEDVRNAAMDGVLVNAVANEAYQKHCVRRFGVKIVRPSRLFGWASETTDFWDEDALRESIRCTDDVYPNRRRHALCSPPGRVQEPRCATIL